MARLILVLLALLLQAGAATAAPVVAAVAAVWSAIGAYVTYAAIAYSIYSSVNQRRKARAAAAKARADYIASLTDRRATVLADQSPHQVVYGAPAPIGGSVVAVLASGDNDQFRHIVVVFAGHECEAIDDILIEGKSTFPLRSDGWSTSKEWQDTDNDGTSDADDKDNNEGNMVSPRVNVQLHTSPGGIDTADAFLMAACPEKWTADHRLSGYTYAVVTLDLNLSRFQGGVPQITARLRGKKVYDPRTGQTAFSRNPALCLADFLRSRAGYLAAPSQIDVDAVIAAANACDQPAWSGDGTGGTALYCCDGAFPTSQDRDTTRQQLEDTMAGASLESGGVWRILAGTWTTPVMSLDDDDMLAAVDVVQACFPGTERFNGARGSYIKAAGEGSATEFAPYQNAVFRESDGKDKFADVQYPFVGHQARCTQLARVRTEQSRGGFILRIAPRMSAWHLQPGDRILLSSRYYGFTDKRFRVQDWTYSADSPLALQVIEDEPSFYDLVDETAEDPAPNGNLPNPFLAPAAPTGLVVQSGPDYMVQQGDVLVARVRIAWDAAPRQDVLSDGRVQVQYRRTGSGPDDWLMQELPGKETQLFVLGAQTGASYDVRVRFITPLTVGLWANKTHTVLGLLDTPAEVLGLQLAVTDAGIVAQWAEPEGLELLGWSVTQLRLGATWGDAQARVLFEGRATSANIGWLPAGVNRVWASHRNAIGGGSAPISATIAIEPPAQPVVTAEKDLSAASLRWQDCKTTQPIAGYRIRVGAALQGSDPVGQVAATAWTVLDLTGRLRRYWVIAYDVADNGSAPGYIEVEFHTTAEAAIDQIEREILATQQAIDLLAPIDQIGNLVDAALGNVADARDQLAASQLKGVLQADEAIGRARARVGDVAATVEEVRKEAVEDREATAQELLVIASQTEANRAAIVAESQTRTDNESATASQLLVITSRVGDNAAAIVLESTTRATADSATATQLSGLTSTVGSNHSQVTSQLTTLATQQSAQASSISTISSQVGAAQSAIVTEQNTRAGETSALAGQISTLTSRIGSAEASLVTASQVSSFVNSAIASNNVTLQSQIGSAYALAETSSSTVASLSGNVSAQSMIKTEVLANGLRYMSGVSIGVSASSGGTQVQSQVLVHADTFGVIWDYNGVPTVPFAVSGGVTYIRKAMIKDADIDTLKLAGNSVTVPVVANGGDSVSAGIYMDQPGGVLVLVTFQGVGANEAGSGTVSLFRDGGLLRQYTIGAAADIRFPITFAVGDYLTAGGHSYSTSTTGVSVSSSTLALLGCKR